jgi:putative phosphonate metabolism protein
MADFPRYAIYYAPAAETALAQFGADLLGYDAWSGGNRRFPGEITRAVSDWAELAADARKYGFHATLKAPFSLKNTASEAELCAACANFAATPRAIPVIRPIVDAISGFIAIIPGAATPALQQLAADCVETFDPFRAPMSPEVRARRKPDQLTTRQRNHLDRWGYPYVMEEFRFHMTLTCRLSDERRQPILAMLRERFAALALMELRIDRILLFHQPDASRPFRIVADWPLTTAERA